jgi:subtilisin-like proprotein convertase family protein
MKQSITLLALLFAFIFSANAQENEGGKAFYSGTVTSMKIVPSLESRMPDLVPAPTNLGEARDGRSSGNKVVIGKDPQTEDDYFVRNQHPLTQKIKASPPSLVFDAYSSSSQPTDPSLAVGPDHVFVVFNTGFIIYDHDGNDLTGQLNVNNIFSNGGCCDLTASYDSAANRWVVSYLFIGSGAEIAVSDGPNPVTANWYVYNISQINDYQKLSVWSDGYYLTENTGGTNKVWAMERAEMLLGNPAAQVIGFNLPGLVTSGFYSPQALNVTDDNMPAAGSAPIIYLQDDAWGGVATDHLKIWTVDVDWVTPGNSTISAPTELTTTPFISVFDGGSFSNLAQPGGGADIDALQATIMNQAQFRKFGGHNSAVFNFVVDTDAGGGELAGVRWFELRQTADGQPWSIHQEGTYTAPDGRHAWHASLMMDLQGNIGMGYTSMSGPTTGSTVRVSSYYTGRYAADPLNTMTIAEELIANGNANIPGLRYGDYSKIDIDPFNDKTFWFINEYMNSGRKGVVGVFQIAPNFNIDSGVVSIDSPVSGTLSASETISVTIFNYGQNAASNFPVTYQIDGGAVINETFTGTIAPATSASFSFATTADMSVEGQSYSIVASTDLSGDEDPTNDSTTKVVTHIFANDIGVAEITGPDDGEGLGMEPVEITIENFGASPQSNFDVSYSIDGGTPVVETITGPLAAGATMPYTFTALGDFSVVGSHLLSSSTLLAGDSDTANNTSTRVVVNLSCFSLENDTDMPIGPNAGTVTESIITYTDDFEINDVNVTVNLIHTWDGDLDLKLRAPDNTEVVLSDRHGGSGDNYTNTVFDDEATTPISAGSPPFTGSFQPDGNLSDFDGMQSIGDWKLIITDNANADGGTLLDWSLQLCEDIPLGVGENLIESSDLLVLDEGNNQFKIQLLTTEITERLTFSVTNMLGQTLTSYRLDNDGTGYTYDLDMSYASAGIYIIRLGNDNVSKAKRLIVK